MIKATMPWRRAQKARIDARKENVSDINIDKLKKCIPEIRQLTVLEPSVFCEKLREILSSCGIAIVFLPHIDGSFLHGASFTDGNHIVLGLTARERMPIDFGSAFSMNFTIS